MNFIKYEDIKIFANENLDLILEKEWLNNLMMGNCLEGLEKGIDKENWLLAKIVDNNKTELIMLYRKPWNLLLYSPTNNISDELYKFAAEEIYKIDPNLNGVNSEKVISRKFAEFYCEISKKELKLDHPMRILLLTELPYAKLNNSLIFRKARLDEKPILVQYTKEFQKEALNRELDQNRIEEQLKRYFENGYYVLELNGKIVSQAVISRVLKKGNSIGEVYTPKEYRGKGYAYNLVYRMSKKALEDGNEYCVLYTDDENPISNHVYEKIGYKRMIDCEDILFI